jgi:hypothetical protein
MYFLIIIEMMRLSDILLLTSLALLLLGMLIYFYYIFYSKLFFSKKESITPDKASSFGEFMNGVTGPVFTLAGFLIIYATVSDQKENNEINQFESRFFQFMGYHRDNNEKIKIKSPKTCEEISGRQTWVNLRGYFKGAYKRVNADSAFKNLSSDQKLDLSFAVLYYGIGSADTVRLHTYLNKFTDEDSVKSRFFRELRLVKHCDDVSVWFYGFSNVLKNYFEEYFQYIGYVDSNSFLSDMQKSEYIDLLISQNDDYCSSLHFFYLKSGMSKEEHVLLSQRYPNIAKVDDGLLSFLEDN